MPKMRVLKEKGFRYAKQNFAKGDVFEVKRIHVKPLKAMKIAEPVSETKAPEAPKASASAAARYTAPKSSAGKKAPGAPKRAYRRRDMKAEA